MSRLVGLLILVIIGSIDLWSVWMGLDRHWSKPLIMIWLIIYFLSIRSLRFKSRLYTIFLLALIFGWIGDVALLPHSHGLIYGLLAFLIMQILYSFCFWNQRARRGPMWSIAIVLGLVAISVILYLQKDLGAFMIPVFIYISAICIMTYTAFGRDKSVGGYSWVAIGSVFFIASDTILSYQLFVDVSQIGAVAVMATYIIAQYCIVQGYIDSLLKTAP